MADISTLDDEEELDLETIRAIMTVIAIGSCLFPVEVNHGR